ncbi:MAG TPA: sigma 54-interacting transcriptional regulator [Polyangiaceae bacterium]
MPSEQTATQAFRDPEQPAESGPAAFVVRVVEGTDTGREVRIDGTEPSAVLIGKGPSATLQLRDGAVSRRHLSLEIEGARLRIRDQGSTNGTRLDAVDVVDAYARGGEWLRIGATVMRIERALAAEPAATSTLPSAFARVIGASPAMRRLYPLCDRLAKSDVPVVIEGETGTGKEALAEALHEAGPRARGPFVVFDCTAVPANLVESELFGHERGAFTGATTARKGMFELAEGGTLLIDEIGDLELSLQPKLLRAVERSEIRRVGGSKPIHCDVRILAATRRDLEQEVQAGRFRDDLFHRLVVARIELPPLRKRAGDVALLGRYFWKTLGGPDPGPPPRVLDAWAHHPWPGNVRELRNAVARTIALGDLDVAALGGAGEAPAPGATTVEGDIAAILARDLPYPRARRMALASFDRLYVERALEASGGSVVAAAEASGIARRYFQIIRERLGK